MIGFISATLPSTPALDSLCFMLHMLGHFVSNLRFPELPTSILCCDQRTLLDAVNFLLYLMLKSASASGILSVMFVLGVSTYPTCACAFS